MLRQGGHEVQVFDAMLAEGVEEFDRQLQQLRPQLVLLYEDSFNFLSKMCLERMRQACCEMIALARQLGARVIAVGSDAVRCTRAVSASWRRCVLFGEALTTLMTTDAATGRRSAVTARAV